MAKIIAIFSAKGGVGKTSLAVNLAGVSGISEGQRTLLWDLDAQGSASFLVAAEANKRAAKDIFSQTLDPASLISPTAWPNLDLLRADPSLRGLEQLLLDLKKPKRLRKILARLAAAYDYIVLDCAPGLNELSDQVFKAADIILTPVIPTPLGRLSFTQIADYLAEKNLTKSTLMPIISMADRRKSLHRAFIAEHADWPLIPQASVIEQMAVKQAPLATQERSTHAMHAYRAIWIDVVRHLNLTAKNALQSTPRGRPRIPRRVSRAS